MNAPPNQNCPEADVLQELAAGIGSPELAQQTMQHVARCATCSAALRRYISEFSEEQSPENAAIFNQLQSSKPQWQKRLVRDQIGGGKKFPWLKLAPAMAALAVAIFSVIQGPSLLADFKVNQAQKQIATAFAGRRTTEMRLPSVNHSDYRPFPIELGGENGRSLDEVPTSLHDASGAANQNLLVAKADPRWLQVQGLALLWESTPSSLEKAEKDFERARSAGLATPSLEIDLAASYFERDSRTEHPNLQRTLNLLSEVLSKPSLANDDRASALFNLALAYEKTQAWDLAVSTWEKYLQVDSSSAWTTEAQQHLKDAKAKMHPTSMVGPAEPAAFLQQVSSGTAQDQVEEYQDVAVGVWLPEALETQNPTSLNAVRALGDLLVKGHSDPWLTDMVSSLRQEDLPAVKALADALKKNGEGDHPGAVKQALVAAGIFARRKNFAGEFRARLEEVNAFRRTLNGSDCLARADPLWTQLSKTKYHWLQARISLEKAECGNFLGEFTESDNDLHVSRQIASEFNFPLLAIRNIGISAGNKHLRGNCDESWKESADGLNVYWQKTHATQNGLYQFYSVMYQCALETGSLYAGEALLRHAIELRETSPDIKKNQIIEGILHLQLANVLLARKVNSEAVLEKQKAALLIGSKGLKPQFDLVFKLEPAEFELEHGDAQLALATLEPLRKALAGNPDKFFSLRFNQVLGNTYYKLRQLDEAGIAYEAAIQTAESALGEIKNWAERLQWLRATDESYRGLVRVLIDQKKDRAALERWELYKSRPMLQDRLANVMQASESHGAKERQDLLLTASIGSVSETRIVYANFNDGIYIWTSRDGRITSQWVEIGKQDFENLTREFVEKCAMEGSSLRELNQLGGKLFAVLLQPVISSISPSAPVIVELDRMAYNLPMEALSAPEGWYFGEKYSVIYSPGIWMEKTLRLPEPVTGRESLFLLDASHAPGAGYLPGLEIQRSTIARLFPRTKVGDPAKISRSEMWSDLASSQLFHYMGHGKADGSGTSLDYDGNQPLRSKDFTPGLLTHSQIVVLAACSGAAGRDNGLADTNNLVRVFLSAGVPSVIASHWNVDSASTSQLMVSFYQHLAKRESVAQAMYNARVDILRTKAHPYFWAGFALAGRTS
jgi:CHAT domain-containing protein